MKNNRILINEEFFNKLILANSIIDIIINDLLEMIENKERPQDIILNIIDSIEIYNKDSYKELMEVIKESEKL